MAQTTEDPILGGRILVRQPADGYRVNVDTILLAAAIEAAPGSRVMEAGCGAGAALLWVADQGKSVRGLGVERDLEMARFAAENIALNGMSDRIEIVCADALDSAQQWGAFANVFFNPPYDEPGEGRAPLASRRVAHIADAPLDTWIAALSNRLEGGGALTLIQRAAKLPKMLAALEGRLGGVEVFPVRPRAGEPAKRVIVRARKGSRAAFRLLKGLDLHDDSGAKHTPAAEAILRGEALIAWA